MNVPYFPECPLFSYFSLKSNEVLNEIYAADASPNRIVRRIIEDFLAFRKEIVPWTRVGEQAYLNARRLPFGFKLK